MVYLYKSYPAAWGEPRKGVVALAVSFFTWREMMESQASRVFLGWKARSGDPGEDMAMDILDCGVCAQTGCIKATRACLRAKRLSLTNQKQRHHELRL